MNTRKLTPEVQERIVQVLSEGNYRHVAAKAAGIAVSTFTDWMRRGKAKASGPHAEFRKAVLKAEQDAEINALKVATNSEDPGTRARNAQWFLERKFPERWGRDRLALKEIRREIRELQALLLGRIAAGQGDHKGSGGLEPQQVHARACFDATEADELPEPSGAE